MSDHPSWRRKIPWLRLVGLILLAGLLGRLDSTALVEIIGRADWFLLGLAIALNLPMVWLKSLRWQLLMRSQGIRYSFYNAYLAYFSSIFVGLLTPGRLGEFVKVVHINQDCGVPLRKAFVSVLADRLFDLSVLLLVGCGALLTLAVRGTYIIVFAGAVLLLVGPLFLFLNNTTFGWIERVGVQLGFLGRKLFGADSWLLEVRSELRQLTWTRLLVAFSLTGLAYTLFFGQCYLLALALQLSIGVLPVSFAVALGSLVTLLPISISGLGTREAAIVTYLGTVGVLAEAALGFSLLVFLTFHVSGGLMGAVAWWMKPTPLTRARIQRNKLSGSIGH